MANKYLISVDEDLCTLIAGAIIEVSEIAQKEISKRPVSEVLDLKNKLNNCESVSEIQVVEREIRNTIGTLVYQETLDLIATYNRYKTGLDKWRMVEKITL